MIFLTLETPFGQFLKDSGQVSLHLFFEKPENVECPIIEMPFTLDYFEKLELINILSFGPVTDVYPINSARNIGRKGIKTELFISGDIEQTYVKNFEPRMFKLAKRVLLE